MASTTRGRRDGGPGLLRLLLAAVPLVAAVLAVPMVAAPGASALPAAPVAAQSPETGTISYVASARSAGNRTSHTVKVPSKVRKGDVLLLSITTNSKTSIAGPAGWKQQGARTGKGIGARLWTRTASDKLAGTTLRVRTGARTKAVLTIAAYRSSVKPTVTTSAVRGVDGGRTRHATPAVKVTKDKSWLVNIWSGQSSNAPGWRLPSSVRNRGVATTSGANKVSSVWGDSGGSVAKGTSTARTATTKQPVARTAMFSVVIAPGVRPNQAPVANFTHTCDLLECGFDASMTSDDADTAGLTYDWDFGDGGTASEVDPDHTYAKGGKRTVTLSVTDAEGAVGKVTKEVDPWDPNASGDITFVDAASTTGNRTSHAVTVPSTVRAGDLLVLFLVTNTTTSTIDDVIPGWTLLESREGNGIRGRAWTRTATPADAGREVSVPGSDFAKSVMSVAAYRSTGPAEVSASEVGGIDGTGTVHTTPATTAARDGSWLLNLWSEKSTGSPAWDLPDGVTERDRAEAFGNGKVGAVLADSAAPVPAGDLPGLTAITNPGVTRTVLFSVVIDPGVDATRTNEAPTAEFTTGCSGLTCEFDASLSFDPDEDDDLTYTWNFGDGQTGTGVNPEHTYANFGSRTVTLTVDDGYVPAHPATATHTATPSPGTEPPGHETLVPDTPRTDQPLIEDGEIWDIEVVGNRVYIAGDFTSIRQPNNGAVVDQAGLAAYNWETGQVDTGFRPVFGNGSVDAIEATPDGSKLFVAGDFGTVDGVTRRAIAQIDPASGTPLDSWQANANGKIFELAVTNSTVYAGGRFTTIGNVPRGALAALDAETGAVRTDFVNNITGGIGTNGGLAVQRLKLTHDEGRLLVVHTGRQVNGQNRYGVAIINTRTNKLTPWKTTLWEDNLQFVGGIQRIYGGDISPDDSQFVVSSGSGGDRPPINDTVIVFNLEPDNDPNNDEQPEWISRHFDSVYSATWTEAGIYIGGHFQWAEDATAPKPWPGLDDEGYGTGQGLSAYALGDWVVKRFHLAALDPEDGHALEWFPTSNSYEGDKHIEATPRGLFVGGDGNTKGGYNVGRIAFFDFDEVPAQNGTQTVITDPIEGRIKPVDEEFEITGTAAATGGIQRVEVEVQDAAGRYLADDGTTWQTGANTINATLAGAGSARTWRVPVTISGNRELVVRARAVATNGTADNSPASKRFETFGLSDQPPNTSVTGPPNLVSTRTFTITGSATDDVGVNGVSFTLRDSQNRYLQDDGTVSGTYSTFSVVPDVVGATSTTWSYEITVPYDDTWWAQARARDTTGQADLDTADRTWIVTETGQPPTVSIAAPAVMVPPTAAQPITVAPGSRMTFSGSANDDQALKEVSISLRNNTTGERLAPDGSWGTESGFGSYVLSDPNLRQPSYNWSYTTPFNLTPGTYTFSVSAEDHLGLGTSSANQGRLTINVQVAGDLPPDGLLNVTGTVPGGQALHLDLAGTATDDKGVAQVKVALEENDSSRYLQPNGTLSAAFNTVNATLASQGATSTTWTLPIDLPVQGDWRVTAYAVDSAGQQDLSTTGATARYPIYPGDQPPVLNEGLLNPIEGTVFPDGKIFVSGRAEDDQAMDRVEVAIVNAAGQYMSSTGTFTSTTESWRTAFLNSPGTPGSNFSYTTPVVPPGEYTVRVRAVDRHGFVSVVYERHATVTHPPNEPPVASFTTSCVQNVCTFDARGSTDENTPTLTYSWNFGNGNGSGPVPMRTYTSAGSFTVTLTARDEWGVVGTTTMVVVITEPPSNQPPTAVLNAPACAGLSCNFSAVGSKDPNTGDSITYRWDWGDGTAVSTSASASHAFLAAGTYTVTLTVTDGWGKATTATRQVTVVAP